jgi:predicted permease
MSVFATLRCWWRAIGHRTRVHREVEEELQFHIDAYANDLVQQGIPRADAERKARIDLGRADVQGEKYRDAVGLRAWDEIWCDLRYGMRGLLRNPGFTAVTILSLALSIGMATAMFSLIHAVLLDVYPYADSDRTVNPIVFDPAHPNDWDWFVLNRAQFRTYRSSPMFEDVLGQANFGVQLQQDDGEQQALMVALTANAAPFLRVKPLIGRGLQPADGDFGDPAPNIAVLGYKFWLKQFAGDASVLGRKLTYSTGIPGQKAQSVTIVGVMPERFTLGGPPDFYVPMSQVTVPDVRIMAFAKLKPGVTAEQASASVDPMVHDFAKQDSRMYPKTFQTRLQPLIKGFTDRSKFVRSLPILFLAVAMLLLIGCANCSILLLARGTTRTHEFALRAAIGASPFRLVRQLLVECLVISLLGSFLGVALSYFLARLPLQLANDLFPSESVVRVDVSVLVFSVVLAVAAGMLFGLWPALRFCRPQIAQTLQKSSRRTATRRGQASLRRLIGGQIALTLVLLSVAGAAVAGFIRLTRIHLGYEPTNTTFIVGSYLRADVKTWADRIAKNQHMRDAVAAIPGVVSVAMGDDIPPGSTDSRSLPFEIVGNAPNQALSALQSHVDANYFSVLQIPLVTGRIWTEGEGRLGLPLAVVNQAFVRKYSPNRSILGRTIRLPEQDQAVVAYGGLRSPSFTAPEVQVVGVTADVVNSGLGQPVLPNIYSNINILAFGNAPMFLRTQGDPSQYTATLRRTLHEAGASYIFVSSYTLDQMLSHDETWRRERLTATLFGIFAVAALALALVGLYSVVAYLVAQRTQEFGIRLALGATRGHILWLVLKSNVVVIVSGTAIGLILSVLVRHESERWLEGTPQNAALMLGTAGLLILVAIVACLSPARRAAMTQPNQVLQAE